MCFSPAIDAGPEVFDERPQVFEKPWKWGTLNVASSPKEITHELADGISGKVIEQATAAGMKNLIELPHARAAPPYRHK